jgi:peptidoglycan-associated lipoprotein
MYRVYRAVAISLMTLPVLAACRKKQAETAPAPVPVAQPGPDTAAENAARRERERLEAEARAAREREERERAIAAARATLTATIYFDYDRSELTSDARAALDSKVPILSSNPNIRLRIAGHTDSRGSDEYNLALGQRRAASAKAYLTDRGIDGSRIEIVSFGEERGVCTEEDESCWSRNRRDEFEITAGGDNITVSQSR